MSCFGNKFLPKDVYTNQEPNMGTKIMSVLPGQSAPQPVYASHQSPQYQAPPPPPPGPLSPQHLASQMKKVEGEVKGGVTAVGHNVVAFGGMAKDGIVTVGQGAFGHVEKGAKFVGGQAVRGATAVGGVAMKGAKGALGVAKDGAVTIGVMQGSSNLNDRNNQMVMQLGGFARQVTALHTTVTNWSNSIDAGLGSLKMSMDSTLPKPFDVAEGAAQVWDDEDHKIGHSVNTSDFPEAAITMRMKLQQEVLDPLQLWMSSFASIVERNKKTHALAVEVDMQRNVVARQADKVLSVQTRTPSGSGAAEMMKKLAGSLQNTVVKPEDVEEGALVSMQTEEDKLCRLEQRFVDLEADTFNALLDLIKDAHIVREYAAAAVKIMQDAMASSFGAFNLSADADPFPLPKYAFAHVQMPNVMPVQTPVPNKLVANLFDLRKGLCTSAKVQEPQAEGGMRSTMEYAAGSLATPVASASPDLKSVRETAEPVALFAEEQQEQEIIPAA